MEDKNKRISGKVIEVKYYPEEKSIALVLEDKKTNQPMKPIQIPASAFTFRPDQDVDQEMQKVVDLLKGYKHTITLVFNPDGKFVV